MRRIVLILATIFSISQIQAQGLEIGVYANPQFTWITSNESHISTVGSPMNLNTGIEFDFFFMPNYAFTLGVNLNNQGGRLQYQDSTTLQQTNGIIEIPAGSILKHNLQYLGIPFGLKLKSEELGYSTFFVHGGLLPLFNLKATTSSDPLNLVRENIRPDINLFSLNYFAELGIEYRLAGNTAVVLGFVYSAGFNDVTRGDFANNNLGSAGLHLGILF